MDRNKKRDEEFFRLLLSVKFKDMETSAARLLYTFLFSWRWRRKLSHGQKISLIPSYLEMTDTEVLVEDVA
jgi:hypothetical protein